MNKYIIFFLIILFLLSGCQGIDLEQVSDDDLERIAEKAIVCEKPYMRFGTGCCLDQNDNSICDTDEKVAPAAPEEPQANKTYEETKATAKEANTTPNKNCREVEVPYTVEETYTEYECQPAEVDELFSYKFELVECKFCRVGSADCPAPHPICGNTDYHQAVYEVTNREDKGGDFTFEVGITKFYDIPRKVGVTETTKRIPAQSTAVFESEFCETGRNEGCWINPKSIPTIHRLSDSLETCGDIPKTRTVTKYRTETACE